MAASDSALTQFPQGLLTASVNLGFIAGSLWISFRGLADCLEGRVLFLISACSGALLNIALLVTPLLAPRFQIVGVSALRFGVGACLAGVYPVGMKIAAGYYNQGLGKALGYLLAALVLGTALPFFLAFTSATFSAEVLNLVLSLLAIAAGLMVFLGIPDGPHERKAPRFDWRDLPRLWKIPGYRGSSVAYWGHMWELYAFWAFLPAIVRTYSHVSVQTASGIVFLLISAGAFGCVLSGELAEWKSSHYAAFLFLGVSGIFCLVSPWAFSTSPLFFYLGLSLWGLSVVADSPQFSTMIAESVPSKYIGTALTFSTGVGFLISTFSLFLFDLLNAHLELRQYIWILAIGPLWGFTQIRDVNKKIDILEH